MNQIKINGAIHHIGNVEKVSEKFQKRDFVIETGDKFPQKILMQVTQDKVSLLDNLKHGDLVECSINLRGREWVSKDGEVKWFNTIECWSMQFANAETQNSFQQKTFAQMNQKSETPSVEQAPSKKPLTDLFKEDEDDLPF
jgi:single-strand DNA-binding protein